MSGIEENALIQRQYRDLESKEIVKDMSLGKLYEGELLFILPEEAEDVLIRSPLPSGVRGLNVTGLMNDAGKNVWSHFRDVNIQANEIRLFAEHLPAGVYTVYYTVQAGWLGEFDHLPAELRLLYGDKIYARTKGEILAVNED